MDVRLIAQSGRSPGQALQVKAAKFFIGSHPNCLLRPNIPEIGGIHALVEQREGRVFVRDFGVEGGTTINDRVLRTKEIEVFDGDLIQIGPMVLSLVIAPKAIESPRSALAEAPPGWPFEELAETAQPKPAEQPPTPAAPPPPPVTAKGPGSLRAMPTGERAVWRSSLSYEMTGDLMVITLLTPVLTEEDTIAPMRQELREILDQPWPRREVIDMEKITFVSSRAVGVILAHYQGILREGGTMRLAKVSPRVKPVLEQMRVHMLIDIFPSLEEAVQTAWD
jgi:anti-anti-sigma factor